MASKSRADALPGDGWPAPVRRMLDGIHRSWPQRLAAEQVLHDLVAALPGGADPTARATLLAPRLRDDPSTLAALIDELLREPDTVHRHAPSMLASLMPTSEYQFVSIGTHCFTASLLRRWGLRLWSGPFDWLFSSVAMAAHCIDDDFTAFLDRAQYEPVPIEQRPHGPLVNRVHHRLYRDRFGIDYVFNHHDAHLDPEHAHFTRSVERFRACLTAQGPTAFVVTRTQGEGPLDDLRLLRDALARRCDRFTLIAYEIPPADPALTASPRVTPALHEGPLMVFEMVPVSTWQPLRFDELIDEHVLVRDLLYRLSQGATT